MNNSIKDIDILYRKGFVDKITKEIEYVGKYHKNLFIMIDGEWGSGKSFILDLLEEEISNKFNIVKYNCWESSYYDDPLTAILSMMYDIIQQGKIWTDKDRKKIKRIIELPLYLLTFGNSSLYKLPINIFSKLNQSKNKTISSQISDIKEHLRKINETTVFLVDELDRCLPEYAIKVLERLYLLFKDVPNVVVLIGNNNEQLCSSIENIFGNKIGVDQYLKKFIDKTFSIDYCNVDFNKIYVKYIDYFCLFKLNHKDNMDRYYKFISLVLSKHNPRDQKAILDNLEQKHKNHFNVKEAGFEICIYEILCTFVPCVQIRNILENINDYKNNYKDLKKELLLELRKIDNVSFVTMDNNDYISKALSMYIAIHYDLFDFKVRCQYSMCFESFRNVSLKEKLLLFEK